MTQAQVTLLVMPISLTLITGALLMLLWQVMPRQPVPVYFSNGTVDRLAEAIRQTAPEVEDIGLVDADGYPVIGGNRYLHKLPSDCAGCRIVTVRR